MSASDRTPLQLASPVIATRFPTSSLVNVTGFEIGRQPGVAVLAAVLLLLAWSPRPVAGQGAAVPVKTEADFAVSAEFVADPHPPNEPRRLLQPIHRYINITQPDESGRHRIGQEMNPFLHYSHLGTDFGFIGEGAGGLGWETGTVCISMPPGFWGGMWHSLAGHADDLDESLDFRGCFPAEIKAKYQPRIVGFEMGVRGKGSIKVEIKSARQEVRWFHMFPVESMDLRTVVAKLDPVEIGTAKFLNWVAESGTDACLDSVNFQVLAPDIPFDEYVFLASYAKLARCYSVKTGLVRDRAHLRAGSFDNVPATGFFALGTAIASRLGMVEDSYARRTLHEINANVLRLPRAGGLLPHFTHTGPGGAGVIVPGTEFSVVDTSIYYHGMLLAAQLLEDKPLLDELTEALHHISLGDLVDSGGAIRQGLREDGTTVLPGVWRDWGGETALVLALAAMTQQPPALRMDATGRVADGSGFIVEIQSLFYPDFDNPRPDAVSGQDWPAIRRAMLVRQKEYFPRFWPGSRAATMGLYGLSAGEALRGFGYSVGGVNLPNQTLLHPHYILMSAALANDPNDVHDLLRRMEAAQLFPPWGLVENVNKDLTERLPMQGALNAGFECLGAYHLLAKHRGVTDEIYSACRANPLLRKGAAVFYPLETSSFAAGSSVGSPPTVR